VIRCVVGLGNPGPHYAGTRHNIGFMALDSFVGRTTEKWRKRWWQNYWYAVTSIPVNLVCCKPATFMNNSGKAVRSIAGKYRLRPEEILVMYDDVSLPLGRVRFRTRGSAGGHNGVLSIIDWLGSEAFPRIRIGIGEGYGDRIAHVLSPFDAGEQETVQDVLDFTTDALSSVLTEDVQHAMQYINSWCAPGRDQILSNTP
jgi:PTH1 family peptidyl-tRNA hydrolase